MVSARAARADFVHRLPGDGSKRADVPPVQSFTSYEMNLTESEQAEYAELLHKWGCSDITPEQSARLEELQAKTIKDQSAGCGFVEGGRV